MDINVLLLDLEIIKQVEEYDKLAIEKNPGNIKMFVDKYHTTQNVTRWYYGYNRNDVLIYLQELANNIEKSTHKIIKGNHEDLACSLKDAINGSFSGLQNLKKTYDSDSVIIAKLILMINKLECSTNLLECYLKEYNDKNYSDKDY